MPKTFAAFVTALALGAAVAGPVRAAQGQQPLSPPAQTTAKIGAATVTIDYGRPSMRGRKIMGELVPFGKVWRTGANRATHLKTDARIHIGALVVPAGEYTLYTIPGEQSWTLIVNKQTGQWGTQYDQSRDLGRVEMAVESIPAAIESFTIGLAATGEKGVLTLEWDHTRASVTIKSK